MENYFDILRVDQEKCISGTCHGGIHCIMTCPVEAIRVYEGHAILMEEKCIACGRCIRDCPDHSISAEDLTLEELKNYQYPVAIPSPALYGQFGRGIGPEKILGALKKLGFKDVFESAVGGELAGVATRLFLSQYKGPKPLISSACPAIVRLIQTRFPIFINQVIPVESPREIAAKEFRRTVIPNLKVSDKEVGIFYVAPCPAEMIAIKCPESIGPSNFNGSFPITQLYGNIFETLMSGDYEPHPSQINSVSVSWAAIGGEIRELEKRLLVGKEGSTIVVDGVRNVIKVLEEVENGQLKDIEFIEARACLRGCVGGALTVGDRYVAASKVRKLIREFKGKKRIKIEEVQDLYEQGFYSRPYPLKARPVVALGESRMEALKKMVERDRILKLLPGIDCGSCGAPSCRVLAEDIVQGRKEITDCIFKLREKVKDLAEEVLKWASKTPSSMP
ncbi:MAG: 4Fe-4S binding protein [Candidatus Tectomicrobia bacterium]|uniref:4Fe-4S binding protein n=1 Tax=Tectimicrobiota bacterium TaxID=2528274 RepID=A0A933GN20_UNCTE|nr:4Fe-4S binding protein [Candidatus Tectomicrobia bacterium]